MPPGPASALQHALTGLLAVLRRLGPPSRKVSGGQEFYTIRCWHRCKGYARVATCTRSPRERS